MNKSQIIDETWEDCGDRFKELDDEIKQGISMFALICMKKLEKESRKLEEGCK